MCMHLKTTKKYRKAERVVFQGQQWYRCWKIVGHKAQSICFWHHWQVGTNTSDRLLWGLSKNEASNGVVNKGFHLFSRLCDAREDTEAQGPTSSEKIIEVLVAEADVVAWGEHRMIHRDDPEWVFGGLVARSGLVRSMRDRRRG
jgi:hypothetical protein